MKKIILTLCSSIMFIFGVQAQSNFGAGIKAGLNVAKQTTSGDPSYVDGVYFSPGFHGGAYANYFFIEKLAVQLEILYSQKGCIWTDNYWDEDVKEKLAYVDIPLLLRLQILEILNVHACPQFGFLLNAKEIGEDWEEDVKEYYNNMETALAFGAEVNLPFRLNITLRYILGLSSATEGYDDDWKNNVIQLSAGFRLVGK